MFKLKRKEIRKALADYKEAKKQHNSIRNDKQIQNYFESYQDSKANKLIKERYPLGKWNTVQEKGLNLITLMTDGIPEWKDIKPDEVWKNLKVFKKLLALAEKV